MQAAIINIGIRGMPIFRTKQAVKEVVHIPATVIQRRDINHNALSMSSSSTKDLSDSGVSVDMIYSKCINLY
jgi:hypothetical protein